MHTCVHKSLKKQHPFKIKVKKINGENSFHLCFHVYFMIELTRAGQGQQKGQMWPAGRKCQKIGVPATSSSAAVFVKSLCGFECNTKTELRGINELQGIQTVRNLKDEESLERCHSCSVAADYLISRYQLYLNTVYVFMNDHMCNFDLGWVVYMLVISIVSASVYLR